MIAEPVVVPRPPASRHVRPAPTRRLHSAPATGRDAASVGQRHREHPAFVTLAPYMRMPPDLPLSRVPAALRAEAAAAKVASEAARIVPAEVVGGHAAAAAPKPAEAAGASRPRSSSPKRSAGGLFDPRLPRATLLHDERSAQAAALRDRDAELRRTRDLVRRLQARARTALARTASPRPHPHHHPHRHPSPDLHPHLNPSPS